MEVYIFRSARDPHLFALTNSPSAPRFALNQEQWVLVTSKPLESLKGIDVGQAQGDIEADGVNLCRDLSL